MFQSITQKIRGGPRLDRGKLELIDAAYAAGARSFADLGGVWRVDGGYSYYAESLGYRGFLVDTHPTDEALKRTGNGVTFIKGNFSDPQVIDQVQGVDAVFLFDVLLHQVRPDWNEVLSLYSWAPFVLIYNQQWTGPETVRLLDLGEEEYFANTPHEPGEPPYDSLFDKLDTPHPDHGGRHWRDVHHIWQWGITDTDLTGHMRKAGYELKRSKDDGRLGRLPRFQNKAFLFKRA